MMVQIGYKNWTKTVRDDITRTVDWWGKEGKNKQTSQTYPLYTWELYFAIVGNKFTNPYNV